MGGGGELDLVIDGKSFNLGERPLHRALKHCCKVPFV